MPRISDFRRGKVSLFSLDTLVNMLAAASIHIRTKSEIEQATKKAYA